MQESQQSEGLDGLIETRGPRRAISASSGAFTQSSQTEDQGNVRHRKTSRDAVSRCRIAARRRQVDAGIIEDQNPIARARGRESLRSAICARPDVGSDPGRRIEPPCLNSAGGTGDFAHRHGDSGSVSVGNVSDDGLSVAGACCGCCRKPGSVASGNNRVVDVR